MKVQARAGGETRIVVSSASGRDLGLFLLFAGLVATAPAQYMYEAFHAPHFVQVLDWGPAIYTSVVLVLVGLLFVFNTHKVIEVKDHEVLVRDGFWRRPLRFQWQTECAIKLRAIDQEVRHRAFEVWQIKLVSQGYEYLIDSRPDQQITSRRLAESLAKGLNCDMVETDQGQELVIAPKDLDVPFAERVRKYPQILGKPVNQPKSSFGLVSGEENGGRYYRWGVQASWLLLEIVMLAIAAFCISFVPWENQSIFLLSVQHNNNTYYYGVLLLIVASCIVLPGFRAQLLLQPDQVSYQTMLWRVPMRRVTIPMRLVEEIRQHEGIRGPIVQIISDQKIISFRVLDRDIAAWLAYQIGLYVSGLSTP